MRSELVPTIRAGVFVVSGTASQLLSGLAFSSVERGLNSTPPCSRDVRRYVRVVRTCALGTAPGIIGPLRVNGFVLLFSAPLTARPSPGQSGQEGTRDASGDFGFSCAISTRRCEGR